MKPTTAEKKKDFVLSVVRGRQPKNLLLTQNYTQQPVSSVKRKSADDKNSKMLSKNIQITTLFLIVSAYGANTTPKTKDT